MSTRISNKALTHTVFREDLHHNGSEAFIRCPYLLHTNRPLSKLEINSIQQAIAEAKTGREHFKREIAQSKVSRCSNTIAFSMIEREATVTLAPRVPRAGFSQRYCWKYLYGHYL